MAQPDPDLPGRVLASLEDGTPLVTGRQLGDGRVVLFHVTASADWSSLPLSGLFVQMLERLTQSAGGLATAPETLAGTIWTPLQVLDGFGELAPPSLVAGVPGERLAEARPSPETPPGIYASGERRVALNVMRAGRPPRAARAAARRRRRRDARPRPRRSGSGPGCIALALVLLALDVLATLVVSGRLRPRPARAPPRPAPCCSSAGLALAPAAGRAGAQAPGADADALYAANETVLAYVRDRQPARRRGQRRRPRGPQPRALRPHRDRARRPGGGRHRDRTTSRSIPFLYWPITESQAPPSDAAVARLNDFLRFGGMILFDTQDADLGGSLGGTTPNGRALQRIAMRLDVPPLEPVPHDHVLTRTFYLLQDFPGRWTGAPVWVEASPDAEEVEGMPFRNLNDGVTPVVIGGNDWAAAWAVQESGQPMFPVGRGIAGERQRELALRFGVNLIMYVMTGNYKSDQVHVPGAARPAGAVDAVRRLRPAAAAAADRGARGDGAGRRRARALARADRLVAARARRAGAARRARRPVAPPRGPDAGAEHRHRRASTTAPRTASPAATPSSPRRSTGSRPGSTGSARAAASRCAPSMSPTAARTGTQLLTALAEATAELPADRIAGAILVTDGQVHDADALDDLPRPGAGAADRQRRRLGPPRRRRDRARLRHRRRGGQPRRSASRISAPRPRRRLRAAVDLARRHRAAALRRAGQPQRDAAGDAAARRRQRAADRHARGRGRADRPQQRRRSSRSTACATGCGCCSSRASPIRASGPGGTC